MDLTVMTELAVDVEKEILYFQKYKESLFDFLNKESMNLTIKKYMMIVNETKRIESHVKELKK